MMRIIDAELKQVIEKWDPPLEVEKVSFELSNCTLCDGKPFIQVHQRPEQLIRPPLDLISRPGVHSLMNEHMRDQNPAPFISQTNA